MTAGPLTAAIAAWAARDPARAAFIDRGAPVTYAALDRRVAACAGWLARQGLRPGDMVGVTLREDIAHITAALALLRLGCDQVTLASHDPPALRAALARRLGVALLLAEDGTAALPGLPLLHFDPEDAPAPGPAERPGRLILTSSGTTGRPKLIPLREADIARQVARRAGEARVFFRSITVEHNNAKKYHLGLLGQGATTMLANCAALPDLAEACARHGVGRVTLPPERAAALAGLQARPGAHPWPARTSLAVFGAEVPPARGHAEPGGELLDHRGGHHHPCRSRRPRPPSRRRGPPAGRRGPARRGRGRARPARRRDRPGARAPSTMAGSSPATAAAWSPTARWFSPGATPR